MILGVIGKAKDRARGNPFPFSSLGVEKEIRSAAPHRVMPLVFIHMESQTTLFVDGCDNRCSYLFQGWKKTRNRLPHVLQPFLSLCFRTNDNDIERPAVDIFYAAESEDAVFPYGFQGITEYFNLSFSICIGGIEYEGSPGLQ